ncbi:hypothetical protein SAMN02910292_01963 [Lachnospiraceae bacterium XBB2008]|nr:hypothetical protein SAMN02910292_01963 [Lachnospiraceae bacterium XBB2008]
MRREKNQELITERNNKIKETVKSLIFPTVLAAIIFGVIFFVINYQNIEKPEEVVEIRAFAGDEKPVVMENDYLIFTMDPLTTQFTVEVKETGKVWYSNPQGAADDPAALPEEKNKLQSPLLMSYAVETGLETSLNCFDMSIANGIYEIEQGDDYIRVDYSLGNVEKEYVIPTVMTKESYDKWTSLMDDSDVTVVSQYYKKYDINKLSPKDDKDELLANYPELANQKLYILRSSTKESVRKKLQGIFEAAGYTYDDFTADKELDLSVKSSDKPIFDVSMIYRLDGDDMTVEIPFSDMQYKSDYPIYTLTPLPYFGAGGPEDTGYLMVPEGGGSLINFNNGKTSQNNYYANVYGWDMCLTRKAVVHNTRTYYAVYGVASGDDSFICVLEDGRSYAAIQADIAGKNHSYNYVNAIYSICQREQYDVGDIANSDVYKYVESLPDESLVQRYSFVSSGDYTEMAKDYRDYLKDKYGQYLSLNTDSNAPVVIEVVGAVDKIKQVVGVPVSRPLKLTTFDEAGQMLTTLHDEGLNNMSVKLSGWCNGGVKQKVLKRIRINSKLGSGKDLQALADTVNGMGANLYLNGITQYAWDSNITDGFFSYTDAAKLISKERVQLMEYSRTTYAQRDDLDPYYLLHTDIAGNMSDNLSSQAQKYGVGASFENDGRDLSSDFYRKNPHSREAVSKLQEERFKSLDSTRVMINMGNDYAVPYVDVVTEMDLRGSEYTILDEYIPFYQLALHGYIDYTGKPVNICGNAEEAVLCAAEYGAGLSYTIMKESAYVLQKTLYTEYYGSEFDSCHKDIVETYNRYNSELGHTFNQEMSAHSKLTENVSCTEYEDGTKVYVNYGYSDYDVDGVTVPARDYLVVR